MKQENAGDGNSAAIPRRQPPGAPYRPQVLYPAPTIKPTALEGARPHSWRMTTAVLTENFSLNQGHQGLEHVSREIDS